jgi:hypothetical protein
VERREGGGLHRGEADASICHQAGALGSVSQAEFGGGHLGHTHRACLQQKRAGSPGWEPLVFFSKKLEPTQVKYSAFDRKLLACFLGIRHFRFMLEGRAFTIYTDHKPPTTAANRSSDPWTAPQCRQLACLCRRVYLRHLPYSRGEQRGGGHAVPPASTLMGRQVKFLFTFSCGTRASGRCGLRGDGGGTGVLPGSAEGGSQSGSTGLASTDPGADVLCDVSTAVALRLVPATFRTAVFAAIHGLAHPSIRATRRLVSSRFVWHGCASDVAGWC